MPPRPWYVHETSFGVNHFRVLDVAESTRRGGRVPYAEIAWHSSTGSEDEAISMRLRYRLQEQTKVGGLLHRSLGTRVRPSPQGGQEASGVRGVVWA